MIKISDKANLLEKTTKTPIVDDCCGSLPATERGATQSSVAESDLSKTEQEEKAKIRAMLQDSMGRLIGDFSAMGHMPWTLADELGMILDRVGLFDAATEAVLRAAIDLHAPGENHATVIRLRMPKWFARQEAEALSAAIDATEKEGESEENGSCDAEKTARKVSRL